MTQNLPSVCDSCLRRKDLTTCEAFPRGIPESIRVWGDNHATPIRNQGNDLVWVFNPGSEEQFNNWKEFVEQRVR